jgi:ABC-type multidrug transport system fused ATPase/permease subunit
MMLVLEQGTVVDEGGFREAVGKEGRLWKMFKVWEHYRLGD